MTGTDLTQTEYTILALIGRQAWTAHDLARLAQSGKWPLLGHSRSSCYGIPRRLERRGYLRGEQAPAAKGVERRLYRLTDSGVDAVTQWLARPLEVPIIDSDLFIRTLSMNLMRADEWLKSLLALRRPIEHRIERLKLARIETSSTYYEPAELFAYALHEEVLNAYLIWLDRVESEVRKMWEPK